MDSFPAYGEAIMKITVMVYLKDLEDMTFKEVSQVIQKNFRPKKKLVIAEMMKFLSKNKNRMKPSYSIFTVWSRSQDFESCKNIAQKKWLSKKNCYS